MVLAVVLVFTLIALVVQNRRVTSLEVRLLRLTRGRDDGNLQDVLESHLDTVARVADEVDQLAAQAAMLDARTQRSYQRLGFVRFNPFEDTGSNQSFALALLDGRDDGLVISSLHSRSATRLYAKTVTGGQSDAALSDEEAQALDMARTAAGPKSARAATTAPPSVGPAAPTASVGRAMASGASGPVGAASSVGAGTTGVGGDTAR